MNTPDIAAVADGLRELATTLESGELGELGAVFAERLCSKGIEVHVHSRDEFIAAARFLEAEPDGMFADHWLAVRSMCGPIPLRVVGYRKTVGDSVERAEVVEDWVLPAELTSEAVSS